MAATDTATAATQYELGRVQILGGNEVYGVPDGVILQQSFGPDCGFTPTPAKPFSGSLGTSVDLALEVIGCPQGGPPPEVQCSLHVGASDRELRFTGWTYSVNLDLPELTGVFPVTLRCAAGGEKFQILLTELFQTYQPPLGTVSPPLPTWYLRACEWGAGLGAKASEDQVVSAIVEGLFEYGERHWRYGYCQIEGSLCTFGETTVPLTTCGLRCVPPVCYCDWASLIEEDTPCNFADCFRFSDVLQYMTAVMGVGGMTPLQVYGKHDQGFATQGSIRSLDPAFTGNYLCGQSGMPCSYLFLNHDLRLRGNCSGLENEPDPNPGSCTIFDATFGRTYRRLDELYGSSAIRFGNFVVFPRAVACPLGEDYGDFSFYLEESNLGLCAPAMEDPPAVFAERPPKILGRRNGAVEISVEVEVRRPGSFRIHGVLHDDRERVLAARPAFLMESPVTRKLTADTPDLYEVVLSFSSEEIRRAGGAARIVMVADLYSEKNLADRLEASVLPPSDPLVLGELPVRLGPQPNRVEKDGDRALLVKWPVTIEEAGEFLIEARLFSGPSTIAYAFERLRLDRGDRSLTARFQAVEIFSRDISGEYLLTITVHNREPLYPIDSITIPIGNFKAADFQAAPP